MANAGIAQLVEQLICNQQVVGSNPTAGFLVNHVIPGSRWRSTQFQSGVPSPSVAACNCISGSSQIFSQFRFHLDGCFKRHRVQMFVKLWHQSHAIFPDDPSRFITVFVIFESVIDRDSCHSDIHAGFQGIALRIQA
jgi:hypothetical protein